MITCQVCGTKNIESSQFCDECGTALNQSQNKTADVEPQSFITQIAETPVFHSTNVTSVGIPGIGEELKKQDIKVEKQLNPKRSGVHAFLVIERGDAVGTEFNLTAEESYIGRWDADNGIFPDVDLDAYDSEAKVSRRHARIICAGDDYAIEDLGSTNGTYINRGRRLIPGNAHILNDGDEIIVGKTFLRFNINN
jgi:hypothetical protein